MATGIDVGAIEPRGLLPDPEPRPARYTIISVDDHLIEPPDLFRGRFPSPLADQAPDVVETADGRHVWVFDGKEIGNIGLNACSGRPREEWALDPARFDEMRKGCWDVHERVRDMDINGVWASLNFPSFMAGFCGSVFWGAHDPEVGLAALRAWNDWHVEEWAGSYPERIIPLQIPWLADVGIATDELLRNAARGVNAVSFCENPANHGLPSLHSGYWDRFFAACEETGTVVCLHVGSAQWSPIVAHDAPLLELGSTMFPVSSLVATADWFWSGVPLRFPGLKIAMSEGGIGWVPMLLDRLDHVVTHSLSNSTALPASDLLPSEVIRRNFWFCSIDDPSTMALRHVIGVENIMLESDYPHSDSTWPDTQAVVHERIGHLPAEEIRLMTHANAAALFRHPLPADAGRSPGSQPHH